MGIEISKIDNIGLRRLANSFDKDGNHILEDEEATLFEQKIASDTTVSDDDFKQALGLITTTNPIAKAEGTPSATTDKNANKEVNMTYLHNFVNSKVALSSVVAELDKLDAKFKENGGTGINTEFKQAVKDVVNVMPAYTTSKEVGKKHKEVEKKLSEAGKLDDIHKKVLKELEKIAKNDCIAKQEAIIDKAYEDRILDALKKGEKISSQKIMDEIKSKAKENGTFKDDYKEAFKHYDQPMLDAYDKVFVAIDKVKNLEKGKKVQDKAEEILKNDGQWDKYTKEALYGKQNVFKKFGRFLTGHKNLGRVASDNQGRFNKVENHKVQSEKDVLNALKNDKTLLIALENAGYAKKVEAGWDLSKLSEEIGKLVGADAKLNRDAKKDTDTSEKRMTRAKLAALTKLNETLSDGDTKKLVKLCGYDIEGKHVGKAIFGALIGGVSGAALTGGSAVGAGAVLKNRKLHYSEVLPSNVEDITEKLKNQLGQLPAGITVDISGIIEMTTAIAYDLPMIACKLSQLGLYASIPGALAGMALGLTKGLEDKGQAPKIPSNFDEMDYKEFVEAMQQSKTEYAEIAIYLAGTFVDGKGNWDRNGFSKYLNVIGGDKNGIINREELIAALQKRKAELAAGKKEEQQEIKLCDIEMERKVPSESITVDDQTYIHKRTAGVGWKEIVEAYYPTLVNDCCDGKLYGPNGAIRALQRELCTDENGNLDKAKLHALITATDVPKEIKLPLKVKDCDRVINKPTPAGSVNYADAGEYRAAMDKVGRDEIIQVKTVVGGIAIAKDSCSGVVASAETPKEAVQKLKKATGKTYQNENEYLK